MMVWISGEFREGKADKVVTALFYVLSFFSFLFFFLYVTPAYIGRLGPLFTHDSGETRWDAGERCTGDVERSTSIFSVLSCTIVG